MALRFKGNVQESQFNDPEMIDPRIHGLIHALNAFVWRMFRKAVWVTDVARVGGKGPHGIRAEHKMSRAVDVRAHFNYWTPEELRAIKAWLRRNFPRSDQEQLERDIDGWYGTLRHHGEDAHEHLHICVEPLDQFREALGVDG